MYFRFGYINDCDVINSIFYDNSAGFDGGAIVM